MAPVHVDVVIATPEPEREPSAAPIEDSAPIDGAEGEAAPAAPATAKTPAQREKEKDH